MRLNGTEFTCSVRFSSEMLQEHKYVVWPNRTGVRNSLWSPSHWENQFFFFFTLRASTMRVWPSKSRTTWNSVKKRHFYSIHRCFFSIYFYFLFFCEVVITVQTSPQVFDFLFFRICLIFLVEGFVITSFNDSSTSLFVLSFVFTCRKHKMSSQLFDELTGCCFKG